MNTVGIPGARSGTKSSKESENSEDQETILISETDKNSIGKGYVKNGRDSVLY